MRMDIHFPTRDYPIYLESGALNRVGELLPLRRKVLIVTDSGVPRACSEQAAAACSEARIVCLPAGESSKTMDSLQILLSALLDAGLTRSDCVMAVGGGMVGDLSGFAAACYLRGIDFLNIPTTLLAQVDSSIGGKTAVDFGGVKNSVGAFYPPRGVLIDPFLLDSLPPRQLRAGLAETIKMAAVLDKALLRDVAQCRDLRSALPDLIRRSLLIKKQIVETDPAEQGLRRVLNFGHTVGHAIEACAGGSLLHGECVALGMLPFCAPGFRSELAALLEQFGLPTRRPFSAAELMPCILHDKKKQAERITVVSCDAPGSFRFQAMLPEEIAARLEETP